MNTIEVIFIASSVLTGATGLMILIINPWRTINQAYVIAASLSSLWLFCVFMAIHSGLKGAQPETLFWLRVSNAAASFLPWSYGLVKITITESGTLSNAIKRSWPWFLAGCLLALLVNTSFYIPDDSTLAQNKRGGAYIIFVSALSVLCILILSDACRKMRDCNGVRLLEIKFFVINICISTLVVLAFFATGRLLEISMLRYVGAFGVFASFGLTVWAICYHRVFDARQVFAALGRRVSTLVVLAGSILVLDTYASQLMPHPLSLLFSAGCGGLAAGYWDKKVIRWLDLDAAHLLIAPRSQIIEWAREEADTGRLTLRFEAFLRDWCQAESVTFHTLESVEPPSVVLKSSDFAGTFPFFRQTGYITTESLARRRPDQEIEICKAVLTERNLAALLAVPRGSHAPSCLVAFGPKHSLRPYTHPDIQMLLELVELMDNILTHFRVAARTAQIEKMESAAMMSRGLAHDLNNLATPVSAFLLHMERRVQPGTAEAEVLADAKHSIRVMQDYIRESLFFARRLIPDFKSLSSADILASTIKLTQTRAQARGVAVIIGRDADGSFIADLALIQRLMQNLVFNGIDATPKGGKVTLSSSMLNDDRIVLSVVDEGPGVPAKIMDRIFEPYFTTKDTGHEIRGMGLGLAICLKISDLHGGEMHVGRAPSGGAMFSIILPIKPPPPLRPHTVETPKPSPHPSISITGNPATR